ncbi:hypothetical protein A3F57_04530 [Candidatus Roizmanbacteria bacterium RIFCSPHIGHO2_12_FULL_36_11]|nr:MAG: hypothetical protein A3F57_04530 [Candidatus Roizmanbacteria bacterium RIFCSPHIGHO2_12_FULL_36_11]
MAEKPLPICVNTAETVRQGFAQHLIRFGRLSPHIVSQIRQAIHVDREYHQAFGFDLSVGGPFRGNKLR